MSETNYEELTHHQLVDLARVRDSEAIEELIQRQRAGKSLRIYLDPRKGGDDQGVAPMMIRTTAYGVLLELGKSGTIMGFKKEPLKEFLVTLALACNATINFLHEEEGMDVDDIGDWLEEHETSDFSATLYARSRKSTTVSLKIEPDNLQWTLGWSAVSEIVTAGLSCAEYLGWDFEFTDEERDAIAPYLSDDEED